MKKCNISYIFVFLISLCLFSCSGNLLQEKEESVIKIQVEDSARTIEALIQPDQLRNFKLTGKKSSEESFQNLGNASGYASLAQLTNARITLPAGAVGNEWDFNLSAELPVEGSSSLTFSAATKCTVKAGMNAVKFVFMGTDLTTGSGAFSVSFDWSENPENAGKVNKAKAILETTDATPVQVAAYDDLTVSNNKVTVAGSNINSGSYRLKVYLCKNEVSIAYWQEIIRISKGITSNASRKIKAFEKSYNITYENCGIGVNNPCPSTVTKDSDLFVNGKPARNGYTFINWYTDNNTWKNPFDVKNVKADTTLYPRWLDNSDAHSATKDTIAQRIAAVTPNDKSHPFDIKVYGLFGEDDFTSAATALETLGSCFNDSDESNDIYITLDFSEITSDSAITSFGYFSSCSALAGIVIPDSSFYEFNSYDKSYRGISGRDFSSLVNLQYIRASENNPYYKSVDGVLFIEDGTHLIAFPCGKECDNGTYITPSSVTTIGENAFTAKIKISKLQIGLNVSNIKPHAFNNCISKFTDIIFEDTNHAWKYTGGTIYNIQSTFNSYIKGDANYENYSTYSKTDDTFEGILAASQMIPISENIISGAGSDDENYDISSEGFYTITCSADDETKWFTIDTVPDAQYYIYYCHSQTADSFQNIPVDAELWYYPALSVYSSNGSTYFSNFNSYTKSFTAKDSQAYICIQEKGYLENARNNKKAYLLIRKVE